MKNKKEQNITDKKSPKRRYIIVAGIILLLIMPILVFIQLSQNPKPDPASEKIIREIVSEQLDKGPNELTDEDFEKIKALTITALEPVHTLTGIGFSQQNVMSRNKLIVLSDIKLLEKFANLQGLSLEFIYFPEENIPRWMKILSNFGIIDLKERFFIDLKPLENLTNLKQINFSNTHVKNIKPLAHLTNLKRLALDDTPVIDLKPIKNLTNLEILSLTRTQVSDIEPIKELKNLNSLGLGYCKNITDEQVEDLKKVLPGLTINRE